MNKSILPEVSEEELKYFETLVNFLKKGNFDKVIKEGKKFILEYPDNIFFYLCISTAYIESDRTEEAIIFLNEAEKRFPDNHEILFQFAKVYENESDFEKAIRYYYKSYEATPAEDKKKRADCLNDIAALLLESGEEDEAIKLWKKGLNIDPANILIKNNLQQSEIGEFNDNGEEFTDKVYSDFLSYRMNKFFKEAGKRKFKSKKEKENFRAHIDDAFLKYIIPEFLKIENMSEDERMKFYQSIEIDFKAPIKDKELPKFGAEVAEHFQNVFPYLPEDGMLVIMLVLPVLEYAGISEEKLNNFITQTETPDGKETKILKWAYEIGSKVLEFLKINDPEKKEITFIEIMKLLSQELNESDSLIVIDYIFERISDGEDSL